LIDRHDQGRYFWELRGCAYWREFAREKIISTKVSVRPTFALDRDGCYLGNTAYFFPVESEGRYLLSLLNSNVLQAYAKRVFAEKQNGWYEVQPAGLESFPVATPQPEQQRCCERLVDYLLWLTEYCRAHAAGRAARDVLMLDYFERLLNGLVYELYFAEDLHAHGLQLFELVARARLPVLSSVPKAKRLARLRARFEAISSSNHPLRGALDTLPSVETVRFIEGHA
jgi:hypothetical protein